MDISQQLSDNLKNIRQKRGITQNKLSTITKISRSSIALFESGQSNPSLKQLIALSSGLNMTIDELIRAPTIDKEIYSPKIHKSKNPFCKTETLLPPSINRQKEWLDFERITLHPGGRKIGIPHKEGTREYFFVLQGAFILEFEDESKTISKNQGIGFIGHQKHTYTNPYKSKSVGISIVIRLV